MVQINHGVFYCSIDVSNYGDAITLKNDILKQLNLEKES